MSYRVVVWGTGNVGRHALNTVLSNRDLELVGVIVSDPTKVGRDAGSLCSGGESGVKATDDVEQALSLGADAVAYCASGDFRPEEALDDIERALRAGHNIVSTSVYPLYDPKSAPDDLVARMSAACDAGGSSVFCSGIDPGFIHHIVPIVLSGFSARIDEIRAYEFFNYSTYFAPDAVRDLVGFGMPMDYEPPMVIPTVPTTVWGGMIRLLGRAFGVEIEEIKEVVDRVPLAETVTVPVGTFEAGTQGGLRFEVQGYVGGRPRIIVEHVTRIHDAAAPEWPSVPGGNAHGVKVRGYPNIDLRISSADDVGDHCGGGNATAAAHIVNSIPAVCEAPTGLLDVLDLPIRPNAGVFS